jgi:hypothetical protein
MRPESSSQTWPSSWHVRASMVAIGVPACSAAWYSRMTPTLSCLCRSARLGTRRTGRCQRSLRPLRWRCLGRRKADRRRHRDGPDGSSRRVVLSGRLQSNSPPVLQTQYELSRLGTLLRRLALDAHVAAPAEPDDVKPVRRGVALVMVGGDPNGQAGWLPRDRLAR